MDFGKLIKKEKDAIDLQHEDYENEHKKDKSIESTIKEYAVSIVICVIMALIIRNFIIARADVDGQSMYPTLSNRDVVFVEKISTLWDKYSRGSIVIFQTHNARNDIYIKRVIAIAGDEIEVKGGKVYVNGEEAKEDYLPEGTFTEPERFLLENKKYKVPEGCIFVMGDNRSNSIDSRSFGPVKVEDVKGRAVMRFLPIKAMKIL
ncbi:signal peptidase I [Clostridium thermarum]|uniref:signal peptidase I n=1 Tax=Clostridium thermarum TaxID=1716543 RepID=UPI001FA9B144|nr:signal peptidase I [Clostridium thermarum]